MAARVLWLTKGLGLGGAERLLALAAACVDRDRYDIEVAYVLPWKDAFVPELESHGVRTLCLDARRTTDPRWLRRLRSVLLDGDYDLVHTHSPVPAAAARLLINGTPKLVHTEHNVWARYRWPTRAVNAATYRRSDAVIAVSDGVAESIASPWWTPGRGLPPVEVLHHGVDVDRAPRGPEARRDARGLLGIDPTTPLLGTVANFTAKKDHGGLLRAVDRVRQDVPGVLLLLIGAGPLEPQLRQTVSALGLDDHVRFLGARTDVPALLPAFDLFVLGSRYEGLPISLMEAMAAGVASVATRVGGIPEAIEDGVEGSLIPAGDPTALADAISTLLRDPHRREAMGSASASRVREQFSINRAVRRIEAIYGEVLSEADRSRPAAASHRTESIPAHRENER